MEEGNNNLTAISAEPADAAKPKSNKLRELLNKLGKSPLFVGNHKFITLPLIALALAAIIIIPIVIISSLTTPAGLPDEELLAQIRQDVTPLVIDGDIDGALAKIDDMLNGGNLSEGNRLTLISQKGAILINADRVAPAIEVLEEFDRLQPDPVYRSDNLITLAALYEEQGDYARAIESLRAARELAISADFLLDIIFINDRINELEAKLNGD
jgi:tetratricopeptide (TPR) repeat protein